MKLNPKVKLSSNEMKNVTSDVIDSFLQDAVFKFKLRDNDVMYLCGVKQGKVETVDIKKKKSKRTELF